jgi:hypothetical protein
LNGSVQIEQRIIWALSVQNQPDFTGVELGKNLENKPAFAKQAETEAI